MKKSKLNFGTNVMTWKPRCCGRDGRMSMMGRSKQNINEVTTSKWFCRFNWNKSKTSSSWWMMTITQQTMSSAILASAATCVKKRDTLLSNKDARNNAESFFFFLGANCAFDRNNNRVDLIDAEWMTFGRNTRPNEIQFFLGLVFFSPFFARCRTLFVFLYIFSVFYAIVLLPSSQLKLKAISVTSKLMHKYI